jgi:hypothetical protein
MPGTTNAHALSGTLAIAILFGGCASRAKMAEYSLYVSDSQTGKPVQATALVLRGDPRHPLNLNDLLRPDAFAQRTYPGGPDGVVPLQLNKQEHFEQVVVLGQGYVPGSVEPVPGKPNGLIPVLLSPVR